MNTPDQNRALIQQAGGATAIARLFQVTPQAVGLWAATGVPAERVILVCASCSFKVTPHQLRPDLYPHPEDGLPSELRVQAAE